MTMTNIEKGIWYQSAVSGLWYQNHSAAGDVAIVSIDGVQFSRAGTVELFRSAFIDELKAENAKLREALRELVEIYDGVRVPGEIDSFTLQPARELLSL